MVSGITPCAQECKWIDYFGEPPYCIDSSTSTQSPKPLALLPMGRKGCDPEATKGEPAALE